MFFVLNAYRPETQNLEAVKSYIRKIEDTARAHVTGIVNNTHMLKSTTVKDVINGYNLAKEVSDDTGLPIIYNVCLESLVEELPKEIKANAFPIKLYMREEWML
jgi:ABC-type transport system involved in cytochrome bd biosynthesis fused ATPase/permease subunit